MPRWGDEPVTLDRGDTLYSALAKLEMPGDGLPVVIIASGCSIAENVVTYRLLARAGKRIGAPVAVVTSKPHWRRLAREQGLHAYASMSALRRARTRSIFSWPEGLADALLSTLHPSISRQSWPIAAALLVLAGAAALFVLPVIDITLKAPVETMGREVMVKVDIGTSGTDPNSNTISGRIIEHRFSITDYVETTGNKEVGRDLARGEVTLTNTGLTAVSVPAGTLVTTASGIRFGTTAPVTVGAATPSAPVTGAATPIVGTPTPGVARPQAASAVATVVAMDPGVQGKVPARAIVRVDGDAFRTLTVANELPISGGSGTKARTASADDIARLKETLFQKAQSQSLSELNLRVKQSESLIPHSMQVTIEGQENDRQQDEEGDRIKGTVYVLARAMSFANQDLNAAVERDWRKSPPKGYRPVQGGIQLSPPEVMEADSRTASLKVRVSGQSEPVVDTDRLTDLARGVSTEEAKSRLSRLEVPYKLVSVAMWPEWAPRAFRVEVHPVQ